MLNKSNLYIFTILFLFLLSWKIKRLDLIIKEQDNHLEKLVLISKFQKKYIDEMIDRYQYQIQLFDKLIKKYHKVGINTNLIEDQTKEINHLLKKFELTLIKDKKKSKTNQGNLKKNQDGLFFELDKPSSKISGSLKLTGLKQNINYILVISGYTDHPSNDILKEHCLTTSDNLLGYCVLNNVKSNMHGKIDVSFDKSLPLPPGKYKVRFLVKDADDIGFEKTISENVSFVIHPKKYTD